MKAVYDVIIVGSGLGGLACAGILSKEGKKVLVLEKNNQFGGNLQTFVRDRCIFDTGVHYIGGLDKGQNLYRYFQYLGIADKLRLKQMDRDGYDCISFDNDPEEYPYAQGGENFIRRLSRYFPEEEQAIRKYYDALQEYCHSFPLYRLQAGASYLTSDQFVGQKAEALINSFTENKKLRAVLAGTNLLYAGIKNKTPFYVHALSVNSYIESAWRCIQGGSQIAKALVAEIRKNGGEILRRREVCSFGVDTEKQIDTVHTTNGETFRGKTFISNIDPVKTLDLLSPFPLRKSYERRIREAVPGISSFSLYLVLKQGTFPYLNKNYYHYKHPDRVWDAIHYDPDNWPENYMLSMMPGKNEEWAEGISVLTYMRYEEVSAWANTHNTVAKKADRGLSYEQFKQEKAEKLLCEIEKKFPGIRDCIVSVHASTPLTYRDYIGSTCGSMYGFIKDADQPLRTYFQPRTKIPNLLLTGQYVNMHGILGVTISAVLTCAELLGHDYLISKISRHSEEMII